MITLNIQKILEIAEKLNKENKKESQELVELLGGEKLFTIFDEPTISCIINEIIINKKFHKLLSQEEGFHLLEGLLNNQITGNMGKFYNIKPEYILSLDSKEREKMAKTLSEGTEDLSKLLQLIWNKNISTLACGGEIEKAYILLKFPVDDVQNINRIADCSKQECFNVKVDFIDEDGVIFNIEGDKKDLYAKLLEVFELDYSKSNDLFNFKMIQTALSNIDYGKSLALEDINSKNISEEEVENLLKENIELLNEQHKKDLDEANARIKELEEKLSDTKQKYNSLKERYVRVRSFVVNKLGKIPILGRYVLNSLKDDIKQNALEEKTTDNDIDGK